MGEVIPLTRAEPRPWLLCCNLRAERLDPASKRYCPRAGALIQQLRQLLSNARAADWRVVHIVDARRGAGQGPIDGLEPLATEPVFERQRGSVFTIPEFRGSLDRFRDRLFMAGFELEDTILSTLFAGRDEGCDILVVEDVAASRHAAGDVDEALVRALGSLGLTIKSTGINWHWPGPQRGQA
jgi:nicotinamidase-related amidase